MADMTVDGFANKLFPKVMEFFSKYGTIDKQMFSDSVLESLTGLLEKIKAMGLEMGNMKYDPTEFGKMLTMAMMPQLVLFSSEYKPFDEIAAFTRMNITSLELEELVESMVQLFDVLMSTEDNIFPAIMDTISRVGSIEF